MRLRLPTVDGRRRALAGFGALGLGALAVIGAMAAGRADLLGVLFMPPLLVRFLLGVAAAIVGVVLLLRSTDRMGSRRARATVVTRLPWTRTENATTTKTMP